MSIALLSGFWLGISLILAIGAQNAFVLRQGIRGEHVLAVVLICAISDAIFVAAGVSGMGALVKLHPNVVTWMRWLGVAFLTVYGFRSFISAIRNTRALEAAESSGSSLVRVVSICLMLTWINPHVYLDTVVLLGSISTQYGANAEWFGLGAVIASFVFFFSLGYGARLLRKPFENPASWQKLDFLIAFVMWGIALKLATGDYL